MILETLYLLFMAVLALAALLLALTKGRSNLRRQKGVSEAMIGDYTRWAVFLSMTLLCTSANGILTSHRAGNPAANGLSALFGLMGFLGAVVSLFAFVRWHRAMKSLR